MYEKASNYCDMFQAFTQALLSIFANNETQTHMPNKKHNDVITLLPV